MTATSETSAKSARPSMRALFALLTKRKTLAMFILGFSSGLPYVLITGTLNAWFTNENVDVKTIGVFSWIIIIYGFKFLWSPAVDRTPAPRLFNMGQRRAGVFLFQLIIIGALAVLATASPQTQIGLMAIAAVMCTFAASSQDVLIDAWRIEIADEEITIDLLSSVYQVGFRLAAILGGAGALILAARIGWNDTFRLLALLMAFAVSGAFLAIDSPIATRSLSVDDDAPPQRWRNLALTPVLLGWGWSFIALFGFMAFALDKPGEANARLFTLQTGPLIVIAAVIAPVAIAGILLRALKRSKAPDTDTPWPMQSAFDALYASVLAPMVDVVQRLGASAVLVLALILSYRFTDLVWGAFAYPFYLGENFGALGHTNDEVAIASKLFGSLMTFFGISIGAALVLKFGRMPSLFLGAVLAAATNLLFADLALGGGATHAFMSTFHLYGLFSVFQPLVDFLSLDVAVDEKLSRLMIVIAAENLSVGIASAAIVVYLSSIANPRYAAVQYALFASLTMLIGSLGRGALGELIELRGFAYVFYVTAALGGVAVLTSGLEWRRQARANAKTEQSPPPASTP